MALGFGVRVSGLGFRDQLGFFADRLRDVWVQDINQGVGSLTSSRDIYELAFFAESGITCLRLRKT